MSLQAHRLCLVVLAVGAHTGDLLAQTTGAPGTSRPAPPEITSDTKFASFTFKHINAYDASLSIEELLGSKAQQLRMTVIGDNNSIVVGADVKLLTLLGETIKLMDQPSESRRSTKNRRAESQYVTQQGAIAVDRETQRELSKVEVEIQKAAVKLRGLLEIATLDSPQVKQLQAALEKHVHRAFDVRQRIQRKQLEELQQRAKRIANRLAEREKLKEEIVRRRVESLTKAGQGDRFWQDK